MLLEEHAAHEGGLCLGTLGRCFRRCCPRGISLASLVMISTVLCSLLTGTAVVSLLVWNEWNQASLSQQFLNARLQEEVVSAVDQLLGSLRQPAYAVQQLVPELLECQMPVEGGFDPVVLIRLFESYSAARLPLLYPAPSSARRSWSALDPEYVIRPGIGVGALESIGILLQDAERAAFSWEVTREAYCGEYLYLWADRTTGGRQFGICGLGDGNLAEQTELYNVSLVPLSDQELALLSTPAASFSGTSVGSSAHYLPIRAELDTFALTYSLGFYCPKPDQIEDTAPYALTYAEKSLSQLDAFLAALDIASDGAVFLVETSTDLLVATSLSGQTLRQEPHSESPSRVQSRNASSLLIRRSAQMVLARLDGQWDNLRDELGFMEGETFINAVRYRTASNDVDWVAVLAIPATTFVQQLIGSAVLAQLIAVAFALLGALMNAMLIYGLASVPLQKMRATARSVSGQWGVPGSCISEMHWE
jgi:hypothetical protein